MQALGVGRFGCVFCMFSLFFGLLLVAQAVFALSLVLLMVSLGLSVRDQTSVRALDLQLRNFGAAQRRP